VVRKEGENDRRYVTLHLTSLGREKVKEMKSIEEKMYEIMATHFDPEKMVAL
jgi:DNA-binding MarR family transcriptional regulator